MPGEAGSVPEVDGYEVVEKVGEGGMGTVYRGIDKKLGREVALKFPHPEQTDDPAYEERLNRELRTMAKLNHPGIVQIYSAVPRSSSTPRCFIMELVEGENLAHHMKCGLTADPRVLADILHRVALALQATHDKDIIHRDLKPANIIIIIIRERDFEPKIADFGIAKDLKDDLAPEEVPGSATEGKFGTDDAGGRPVATATRNGQTGTLKYMAPEVRAGKPASKASDVYSLGVILNEGLESCRPSSVSDLLTIAARCVHPNPKMRPTARELGDQLSRFVRGEPSTWRELSPLEQVQGWWRENPRSTRWLTSVIVALLMFTLLAWRNQNEREKDVVASRAWQASSAAKLQERIIQQQTAAVLAIALDGELDQGLRVRSDTPRFNQLAGQQRDPSRGQINDADGRFTLFLLDLDGTEIADPDDPGVIGHSRRERDYYRCAVELKNTGQTTCVSRAYKSKNDHNCADGACWKYAITAPVIVDGRPVGYVVGATGTATTTGRFDGATTIVWLVDPSQDTEEQSEHYVILASPAYQRGTNATVVDGQSLGILQGRLPEKCKCIDSYRAPVDSCAALTPPWVVRLARTPAMVIVPQTPSEVESRIRARRSLWVPWGVGVAGLLLALVVTTLRFWHREERRSDSESSAADSARAASHRQA